MTKIPFNIPPFIGTELEYVQQAIDAHKICGDGQFTTLLLWKWPPFCAVSRRATR